MKQSWPTIGFGKHEGQTIPQIVFADPDYFFWAWGRDLFCSSGTLRTQAQLVANRATRIRVPQAPGRIVAVEYVIHPRTGKLLRVAVGTPYASAFDRPQSDTFWLGVIDLAAAYRLHPYDKSGSKALIDCVKRHVLGNPRIRMTKARCEAFFNEDANFDGACRSDART